MILYYFPIAQNTVNKTFLRCLGHRPVNVKKAVIGSKGGWIGSKGGWIGSKGGWKLSTIFLSCKVFHDRSIIKLGNITCIY